MKNTNSEYVRGAHKTYPQWDEITTERTERFKEFHADLRNQGYEIKAANIAVKDKKMFWILLNDDGGYYLEHYANLLD